MKSELNKNNLVFQRPRGTIDIYPPSSFFYKKVYDVVTKILTKNNYSLIVFPTFEHEELFTAHLGDDIIVHKEMYTFSDRKGRKLVLRPEGTLCTARMVIQNSLLKEGYQNKFYYWGNMFRYERPQKGRYREFLQLGVELLNASGIYADYQILSLTRDILVSLGISNFTFRINYLGSKKTQKSYELEIKKTIQNSKFELCLQCKYRYENNPLRILDCSDCGYSNIFPEYKIVWNNEDKSYVESLDNFLAKFNFPFCYDYSLVRGLDYYTGLIFEVSLINEKTAILGGGRYDELYSKIIQKEVPAIGFAIGVDRLVNYLCENKLLDSERKIDLFFFVTTNIWYERLLSLLDIFKNNDLIIDYNLKPKQRKYLSKTIEYYRPRLLVLLDKEEQIKIIDCLEKKTLWTTLDKLTQNIKDIFSH